MFFFFKNVQEPYRRASLDCCIRVTDNGRESFNRKVPPLGYLLAYITQFIDCFFLVHVLFQILFIFTLYNTTNHLDQLKVCLNQLVFYISHFLFWKVHSFFLNSWVQVVLKKQPNGSDHYKMLHKRFATFSIYYKI